MSNTKEQLARYRKKRGCVSARFTCLEDCITRLENKELMAADRPEITRLWTKIDKLDAAFRDFHENVIELVEDSADALQNEQGACDTHDQRVDEYLQRLDIIKSDVKTAEERKSTPEPTTPPTVAADQ